MVLSSVAITYIGGPTALIEIDGVRFLTDPTFDPGGMSYPTGLYTLKKLSDPAIGPDSLGSVDVVLLSHDHHFDNLDHAGRAALASAGAVLTTTAGAERLGSPVAGMAPWQSTTIPSPNGGAPTVTATPARHGPEGGDRGPVVGFAITRGDDASDAVYITGDTVWFEGVEAVSRRFSAVKVALLFLGAANVAAAGPAPLTLTAEEGVTVARAFPDAVLVPVHFEGWAHFTEGRAEIERAFAAAGLSHRLRWLTPGERTELAW